MPVETLKYMLQGRWRRRWPMLVLGIICEALVVNVAFAYQSYLTGAITVLALTLPMIFAASQEPVLGILLSFVGAGFFLPNLPPDTSKWNFSLVVILWVLCTTVVAVIVHRDHRHRYALLGSLYDAERKERLVEIRERRRIAQDLHDDTIQVMVGALLKLDRVRTKSPHNPDFDSAMEGLRDATNRTRRMMFELRPPEAGKLKGTMEVICTELQRETGIHSTISIEVRDLPPDIEQLCHRIMLEAVNNVRKHASADHMVISMRVKEECLFCRVEGDGVGFDITTNARPTDHHLHFGTLSCQERVFAIGGHYLVTSIPGRGTQVIFDIPLRRSG